MIMRNMVIPHTILHNLCYTELVYDRINKILGSAMSRGDIESIIRAILADVDSSIEKIGKNYYVTSRQHGVRITINSTTHRVITVDRIQL